MQKGMSKRGLSEVVTTLLFVLLALGAVLLVWFVVRNLISGASENVGLEEFSANLEVPGNNIYVDGVLKSVSFIVKRGAGEGTINAVQVVLEDSSGQSSSAKYIFPDGLNPLDSKAVSVKYTLGDVKKISIAPIITTADGTERMGSVAASASVVDEMKHDKVLKTGGVGFMTVSGTNGFNYDKLTVSAWVKADPKTTDVSRIIHTGWASTGSWILMFGPGATSSYAEFGFKDGVTQKGANAYNIPFGQWHNIVGVFDKSLGTGIVYVDGVAGSATMSGITNSWAIPAGKIFIGGQGSPSDALNGQLANIRIYSKALSLSEISKLYNNGLGDNLGSVSDGLVGWYNLDGDYEDSSEKGNDGVGTGLSFS